MGEVGNNIDTRHVQHLSSMTFPTNTAEEAWRQSISPLYYCSNQGRTWGVISGRLLTRTVSATGYEMVKMHGRKHSVSRLIAMALLPQPPSDEHRKVDHVSRNKADRRLANLLALGHMRHAGTEQGVRGGQDR